jgi:hypothetical protein
LRINVSFTFQFFKKPRLWLITSGYVPL